MHQKKAHLHKSDLHTELEKAYISLPNIIRYLASWRLNVRDNSNAKWEHITKK